MSDENVITFPRGNRRPTDLQDSGFELVMDSDTFLEASKGHCDKGVLVLGYDGEDSIYITSNVEGNEELLWLIEKFKKFLLADL